MQNLNDGLDEVCLYGMLHTKMFLQILHTYDQVLIHVYLLDNVIFTKFQFSLKIFYTLIEISSNLPFEIAPTCLALSRQRPF